MGSKGDAQRVAAGRFLDSGCMDRVLDRILQRFFEHVMSLHPARAWINLAIVSRKNVLPHPRTRRVWVFLFQGVRQVDGTKAEGAIALVNQLHMTEMLA